MQQTRSTQQIAVTPQLFGFARHSDTIVGRNTDVGLLLSLVKEHQKVLITGIGGVGKTTLASFCATTWVNNNDFKYAVLINAETDVSVRNGFRDLGEKIFKNTAQYYQPRLWVNTITHIYEHYNKLKSKTIFVLDNIERNCNIHKYLPEKEFKKVFVLGTSQYIEFRQTFKLYALEKFSVDSSVDMICKVLLNLEEPIVINENITKLITDVAEKLDCHPLALRHAAAYIVDCIMYNGMSVLTSVEHYIKTFNEQLEKEPRGEPPTTYHTPIHTALKMNIEKATSENEDVRKLLFCLSSLEPTRIDLTMFYEHPDFDRERIKAPIRELKKYSIISLHDDYINLHRQIQTVYRDLIKTENTENNYLLDILNVLFYHDDTDYFSGKRHHFRFFLQNLNIDKQTMSTLYIRAFHSNNKIINCLTERLRLINCNMDDIKDWSALHCSVFAGHKTFFEYFDMNEDSSPNNRLDRFDSETWTVFHAQIIKDSELYLFQRFNKINLLSFFAHNENLTNKKIVKGLTTLNLCVAFNVNAFDFRSLTHNGCDVNIPDDSGMTPILYAAKNMAYDLVFILHDAGATYDQSYKELLSAASINDRDTVVELLETGDIDRAASDISEMLYYWAGL